MFKITKDGATVAMTEAPNYIKQAENGCFVLCPEAEATGIAHNGTVYHLLGRPDMAGAEITVMLEETDAGVEIAKAADATGIVFVTMAEAGSVDATTAAEHADLFAPWAVPVRTVAAAPPGVQSARRASQSGNCARGYHMPAKNHMAAASAAPTRSDAPATKTYSVLRVWETRPTFSPRGL